MRKVWREYSMRKVGREYSMRKAWAKHRISAQCSMQAVRYKKLPKYYSFFYFTNSINKQQIIIEIRRWNSSSWEGRLCRYRRTTVTISFAICTMPSRVTRVLRWRRYTVEGVRQNWRVIQESESLSVSYRHANLFQLERSLGNTWPFVLRKE